jgi:hypothetical protein
MLSVASAMRTDHTNKITGRGLGVVDETLEVSEVEASEVSEVQASNPAPRRVQVSERDAEIWWMYTFSTKYEFYTSRMVRRCFDICFTTFL